jgi:hypothetical protein
MDVVAGLHACAATKLCIKSEMLSADIVAVFDVRNKNVRT